jgi:hypothetical protein
VGQSEIGREVAISRHLADGEEFDLSTGALVRYGKKLFEAHFTAEEGAGRPMTKGTGAPLSDPNSRLVFPRNNNRISGPESTSCAGCHNQPISGGAGDLSTNVFVLGQRFDFVTFDGNDVALMRGALDERGRAATLQMIANNRSTIDMFGAGYYEMLARQITADLQAARDRLRPGQQVRLQSKGISFGVLSRNRDGSWNTAEVDGLCSESLVSSDAQHSPSLLILPFHQAGATVSLRVFTNDTFNHHHGMQSTERFGIGTGRRWRDRRADARRYYGLHIVSGDASRAGESFAARSGAAESGSRRRGTVRAHRLRRMPYPGIAIGQQRLDLYGAEFIQLGRQFTGWRCSDAFRGSRERGVTATAA